MAGQKAARKGRLDGSGHGHRTLGVGAGALGSWPPLPLARYRMARAQVSRSLDIAPGSISRIFGPSQTKPLSVKRGSLGALKRRPMAGRIVVLDPGSGRTEEPVSGCEPVALAIGVAPTCPPGSAMSAD